MRKRTKRRMKRTKKRRRKTNDGAGGPHWLVANAQRAREGSQERR